MKKIYFVKPFLIYGLVDPITKQLRYIGKSVSGMSRPRSHCYPYYLQNRNHKTNWIKTLLSKKLNPEVIIIQEFDNSDVLCQSEIFWIKYFKDMGCPLTNSTLGGEGVPGFRLSEATKRKLSIIRRSRPPISEETRRKFSEAHMGRIPWNKGMPCTSEQRARLSKLRLGMASPNKGNKYSKERCIEMSKAAGGRPFKDNNDDIYQTIHEAARELNLQATKVCAVLKGRRKSTGGYTFTYLENK